jgi:hypothetical protein
VLARFHDYLTSYAWPGNVRELSQAMESAFAHAVYSPVLFPQHLPVHIRTAHARANVRGHETIPADVPSSEAILAWREAKDAFEREYTQRLLRHSAGNIMEAGRLSGLSRTRLYQLIRSFSLAESLLALRSDRPCRRRLCAAISCSTDAGQSCTGCLFRTVHFSAHWLFVNDCPLVDSHSSPRQIGRIPRQRRLSAFFSFCSGGMILANEEQRTGTSRSVENSEELCMNVLLYAAQTDGKAVNG